MSIESRQSYFRNKLIWMLAEVCPKYADNLTNILKRFKIQWTLENTNTVFKSKNNRVFSYIQNKKRLIFFLSKSHCIEC